ncbi:MAG: thioredoxin family protein [Muribaculaceae bacterium]|nr:thioredoxin family protein [Muribaculaceae bacterium]
MSYEQVINSAPVVLVEFYASWCPHCQRMMPVVADVKRRVEGKAEVYQYDVDKFEALTDENNVESYPTFIIYKDGQEVWRNAGEMPEADLIEAIRSFE